MARDEPRSRLDSDPDWPDNRRPSNPMTPRTRSLRPLPLFALTLSLLGACQRPHVCTASCESARNLEAPATARTVARAPAQVTSAPAATPASETRTLDSAAALAAFDQAWQSIHDTHFDKNFNGVDWDALKLELRPRAERARTRDELREVLGEMVGRLGQSHFAVIPSDALPDTGTPHDQSGGLGFDVRLCDGRLLVVSLEPQGAAAASGVELGWVVRSIGSFDADKVLERLRTAAEQLGEPKQAFQMWAASQARILGAVGASEKVAFLDREDQPRELELERKKRDVTAHEVGPTLPTFYLAFRNEILTRGSETIGVIGFSNWFLPVMQPFDAAVERMRACDGIVIDLRGNTGGAAAMTMGIAGHFFAEPKKLGVMVTRDSTLNILAVPRRVNAAGELVEPFAGPLAILVDETTGSASEVFAGGLQSLGRARIFGATTAGAVLPAITTRLPNGDSLLHAMGDFETSTGVRLEGVGVVPDQAVPLARADLLAGRDAAYENALAWITSQGH